MVRIDDSGEEVKCWLAREELDRLERAAGRLGWEREIAMQLMGRCGLRASEVPYPSDRHLRWNEDADSWLLEVRGKDTTGGAKKTRDAWVPEPIARDITKFVRERGKDRDDQLVDRSVRTVRRWVDQAADAVADDVGRDEPDRWRDVSSHDLRRSWATYHLVERGADVRTMMTIGGWSDYDAIEPYLKEATPSRIGEVMAVE
jgi:integrase